MIKGFHIPFSLGEEQVTALGRELLGSGLYQWIEIKWPCHYLGVDASSYLRGIRRIVDQYAPGVSCHIPTNLDLGQTNTGMRAEIVRQIRLCIDYAADFGATILPLHPGTIMTMDIPGTDETPVKRMLIAEGEHKRDTACALTAGVVADVAAYAAERGMTIALENLLLPQEIAHTAADLAALVDRCDAANVRALFDCGHAHRVGADVAAYVRALGGRIAHVHLNDNDGTCDLHQQLGEGGIPFGPMCRALREVGYAGAWVMETSYRSPAELARSAELLDAYWEKGDAST